MSDDGGTNWRQVADYVFRGKLAWGHGGSGAALDAAIWTIDYPQKIGPKDDYDLQLISVCLQNKFLLKKKKYKTNFRYLEPSSRMMSLQRQQLCMSIIRSIFSLTGIASSC